MPERTLIASKMTRVSAAIVALLALSFTACNRNKYRVVERTDTYVDKQGRKVSDEWYEGLAYDHEVVGVVLSHDGRKIHATCDLSTLDKLDPKASCGLRPLRDYQCVVPGDTVMNAPASKALSDLTCTDQDGHPVYLYVSKEE